MANETNDLAGVSTGKPVVIRSLPSLTRTITVFAGQLTINYQTSFKTSPEDKNKNGILDTYDEDKNFNGVLDAGEDLNNDGIC